jgi:hypothetical protein
MAEVSFQTFSSADFEEPAFGPAIPIRRGRMAGPVARSLGSYEPRYAALMRDLCRARSIAATRRDWVRFRALGEEVTMVGAVIAHQAQLREAAAA